ncbi:MAG: alcohol dehydrogenase catalytic domain-containing protein [Ktedonobacteraceae bacterium]
MPSVESPTGDRHAALEQLQVQSGAEKKERRKMMYALQFSTFGEPSEVVELVNLPDPEPLKANEVLIGMEYTSVNHVDLLIARGWYAVLPSLPAGAGSEGVGRVLAVGEEVHHLQVGDRVLVPHPSPAFCEQIVVPAADLSHYHQTLILNSWQWRVLIHR